MMENWKWHFGLQTGKYEISMVRYGAELPKQELYLGIPKNKRGFATLLYFHGGGLTGDGIEVPLRCVDGELCVIGARYRLSDGTYNALDSLEDAVLATAWVMKHIAEYGGDPKKIFIGM